MRYNAGYFSVRYLAFNAAIADRVFISIQDFRSWFQDDFGRSDLAGADFIERSGTIAQGANVHPIQRSEPAIENGLGRVAEVRLRIGICAKECDFLKRQPAYIQSN